MAYKTITDWEKRVDALYEGYSGVPKAKEIDPREVKGIIDKLPENTSTINALRLNYDLVGVGNCPLITCMTKEAVKRLLDERGYRLQDMDNQGLMFRAKTVGRHIEIVKAIARTEAVISATSLELPVTERKPARKSLWSRIFG